jgi:hypothetical protein
MKLSGDTKLVIASVLVVGVSLWYVKRQVGNAAGAAWDGLTASLGGAYDSAMQSLGAVYDGAASAFSAAGDVVGGKGYTDPATGAYTPYGAVPDTFRPEPGTYMGGWGSSAVYQATQADARRVDNAIDASGTGRRWWEIMATQSV